MATKTKQTAFERKCIAVNEKLGLGEILFFPDERRADAFEDDGCLHVVKGGMRACFDVASDDAAVQNERARAVMTELGMEKKIDDRVLVDEKADEEDEYCPHYGRGGW